MNLKELATKLAPVAEEYYKKINKNLDQNEEVLKLQEEMGEFTKAYLRYTGVGKNKENKTNQVLQTDMEEEFSDLVSLCLLFAHKHDIDLEKIIIDKWGV